MKIKKVTVALGIVVIFGLVAIIWTWHGQPKKSSGNVEKIGFGVATPDASALIYIADRRGFFRDHGFCIQ